MTRIELISSREFLEETIANSLYNRNTTIAKDRCDSIAKKIAKDVYPIIQELIATR